MIPILQKAIFAVHRLLVEQKYYCALFLVDPESLDRCFSDATRARTKRQPHLFLVWPLHVTFFNVVS